MGEGEREAWARAKVEEYAEEDLEELLQGLKKAELDAFRGDGQHVHVYADTILAMAEMTGEPLHKGLGLRMKAQAFALSQGRHKEAMPYFDEALRLYEGEKDALREAKVHLTRIVSLMNLGRNDEVLETGRLADQIFEENEEWRLLGGLHKNLGLFFNRRGDQISALESFEKARKSYLRIGKDESKELSGIELNRAIAFHFLGKHHDSIRAGENAIRMGEQNGQQRIVAMAMHVAGSALRALGNHNSALRHLAEAKRLYIQLGHEYQAALAELTSAEVLNEIRQYKKAVERCHATREIFHDFGMTLDEAGSFLMEALAHQGLGNHSAAQAAFEKAHHIYLQLENYYYAAFTELAIAVQELKTGKPATSHSRALSSLNTFKSINMPVEACYAYLEMAKSQIALGQIVEARESAYAALNGSSDFNMPHLTYQCHAVLGEIEAAAQNSFEAQIQFTEAINHIESWRSNVMSEFQGAFSEDKEDIYEKLIALLIEGGDLKNAFLYADRAKSASLLGLLSGSYDMKVMPRNEADRPIVEEINHLISERGELVFQHRQNLDSSTGVNQIDYSQRINAMEKRITDLWHRLLVSNQDYSRHFSPWQLQKDSKFSSLALDSTAIQYFNINGRYCAFVAQNDSSKNISIEFIPLAISSTEVTKMMQSLQLNFKSAGRANMKIADKLTQQAQKLLEQLHKHLFLPIESKISLEERLLILPHKELHYIPFHALYDGKQYLVEKHEMSFAPNASTIDFLLTEKRADKSALVIGHSREGQLSYTVSEAKDLASLLGAELVLEKNATKEAFVKLARDFDLIHIACHGEFRSDNALFSGLEFENGMLSTLEIFNLELKSRLVTLSACDSGRINVGGGDEIYGMMRAFLSAGAKGLLFSLWPVSDKTTKELMKYFYEGVYQGTNCITAIRTAQRKMIENEPYSHPYFWAPFYYVGNPSPIENWKS